MDTNLERQFAGRRASGQMMEFQIIDLEGVGHLFAWTNDLYLCESATDVKVNCAVVHSVDYGRN